MAPRGAPQAAVPDVNGVCIGAVLSNYQRSRVENVCGRLGLASLAYLWRFAQDTLLEDMCRAGVVAVLIKVACLGLRPDRHLGRPVCELSAELRRLHETVGMHVCGEGGEYETLTLDCPLFKQRIVLDACERVPLSADASVAPVAYLRIRRAHLEPKPDADRVPRSVWIDRMALVARMDAMDGIAAWPADPPSDADDDADVEEDGPSGTGAAVATVRPWSWVTGVRAPVPLCHGPVQEEASAAMQQLRAQLAGRHAVLVYLTLASMADFAAVNAAYARAFGAGPPARVCVQAQMLPPHRLHLDCLALPADADRRYMHVQSISHWAPANIGPYSQAVWLAGDARIHVAGQIGLVPATMQLAHGGVAAEAPLALRHVHRVITAVTEGAAGLAGAVLAAVCFLADIRHARQARALLHASGGRAPVLCVQVAGLPRGASIEWDILAASSVGSAPRCRSRRVGGATLVRASDAAVAVLCEARGPHAQTAAALLAAAQHACCGARRRIESIRLFVRDTQADAWRHAVGQHGPSARQPTPPAVSILCVDDIEGGYGAAAMAILSAAAGSD